MNFSLDARRSAAVHDVFDDGQEVSATPAKRDLSEFLQVRVPPHLFNDHDEETKSTTPDASQKEEFDVTQWQREIPGRVFHAIEENKLLMDNIDRVVGLDLRKTDESNVVGASAGIASLRTFPGPGQSKTSSNTLAPSWGLEIKREQLLSAAKTLREAAATMSESLKANEERPVQSEAGLALLRLLQKT